MRKEFTQEFNGLVFTAKQMSAMDALDIWPRLLTVLGQNVLNLFMALKGHEIGKLLSDSETGPKIMFAIFENCKQGELKILAEILQLTNARVASFEIDGKQKENVPVHMHLDDLFSNPFEIFGPAMWAASLSFQKP